MNSSKKNNQVKLSIIVPAYNEEKTIVHILKKVSDIKLPNIQKEIIVVDDGSKDKTSALVTKLTKEIRGLQLIKHEKNQGKGAAVITGIKNSTGSVLLIQDADLEYNPDDIPLLLQPILQRKAKVVYGTRLKMKPVLFGKGRTPLLLHFFGNKFLSLTTSILYGKWITDMETGYKVFEKKVLDGVELKSRSFDFEPEITAKILRKNIEILELPIKVNPRGYGDGKKIRPVKDGTKALWALVKYRFL